jgi:uncharacterized protein YdeI (YjbR/CyaY-like superfamily)
MKFRKGNKMRKPKFFKSSDEFARWLEKNHDSADELWVGYYKRATARPSITYPESVDVALCYGWIDGLRYSVDEGSYTIRFSPRRPRSNWSLVNVRRVEALIAEARMRPAGLKAFGARRPTRSGLYSYENRPAELPTKYLKRLKANKRAWAFYRSQTPSYRRAATWWVVNARLEETRLRRLSRLIEDSARGKTIAPLTRPARR